MLERLLETSLRQWGFSGAVSARGLGCWTLRAGGSDAVLRRAPDGGWVLRMGQDVSEHRSVNGVLRAWRIALDPGFRPGRAIIGRRAHSGAVRDGVDP